MLEFLHSGHPMMIASIVVNVLECSRKKRNLLHLQLKPSTAHNNPPLSYKIAFQDKNAKFQQIALFKSSYYILFVCFVGSLPHLEEGSLGMD